MVNTLRITSVAAVLLAVLILVSVLGPRQLVHFGIKSDARVDRILQEPNVADRLKANPASRNTAGADQAPPLVKQSEIFAKILNPPAPPGPVKSDNTGKRGPLVPLPQTSSAKFTLIGLSYAPGCPGDSFAYIRLADNTFQWVRKGDEIGHMTIREIRRSSIVCWDGGRESEMMITAPPETASVLEAAAGTSPAGQTPGTPDKSNVGASEKPGQGGDVALTRIADRIRQLQASDNGDPNAMFRNREAIMSQLMTELKSSQPEAQDSLKAAGPGGQSNESRALRVTPKRGGYRPSTIAPPSRRPD
jgi:hypothetical protein